MGNEIAAVFAGIAAAVVAAVWAMSAKVGHTPRDSQRDP